jgi:hypothetical protein
VTGLAEFSPTYWVLVFLVTFLKIKKISPKCVQLYFRSKGNAIILAENGLGYILGDFFTSSSGHPDVFNFPTPKKIENDDVRNDGGAEQRFWEEFWFFFHEETFFSKSS